MSHHPSSPSSTPAASAIRNRELLALQAFVTAKDANPFEHVHATTVMLDLTHSNLKQRHIEIRFDLKDTLTTLRQRITQKTGSAASMQHLQIKSYGTVVWDIPPNSPYEHHFLGYFGLEHGTQVHCIDLDPYSQSRHGGLEDVTLVPKYVMSDEDYTQRSNTLRHWKRQQQEQNPNFTLGKHAQQHAALVEARRHHRLGLPLPHGFQYNATLNQVEAVEEVVINNNNNKETTNATTVTSAAVDPSNVVPAANLKIQVGQRCEVQPGGRRGVVRFVGVIPKMGPSKKGEVHDDHGGDETAVPPPAVTWIGIQFDEPVGKSDGTFQGKRYFDVLPHYGGFCLPHNVKVGDFPERDIFEEDDDDDDDDDDGNRRTRESENNDEDDDEL